MCYSILIFSASLEKHVIRVHAADKFDNNISVQLASTHQMNPFLAPTRNMLSSDVNKQRDVSMTTLPDVMTTRCDGKTTYSTIKSSPILSSTATTTSTLAANGNSPQNGMSAHDIITLCGPRSRDLSSSGSVGKPAFPTGNLPFYRPSSSSSSSSSIVSPIAVYPTSANQRSRLPQQPDTLTSPPVMTSQSNMMTLQSNMMPSSTSLLTSPPSLRQLSSSSSQSERSSSFTSPRTLHCDVTAFTSDVIMRDETTNAASTDISPQNKQVLALSSLLIFTNLVATTTAAMQFSVAKNS